MKSEQVAGFVSESMAGFIGIRNQDGTFDLAGRLKPDFCTLFARADHQCRYRIQGSAENSERARLTDFLPQTNETREVDKLAARLDALIRSSSEVRYHLNADWSELAQLQGGGFIPDNVHGNRNWLDEYIPEEHRDLVRAEIARAIAARDTYNIEHKVNRVDGTVGWALSRAVPLFDEKGEIDSWIGAASDITPQKDSEEALRLLNLELAHRMKNTLAMVQAIVTQTLRAANSIEEGQAAML